VERRCTGCDTSLPTVARFCPRCGDATIAIAEPRTATEPSRPTPLPSPTAAGSTPLEPSPAADEPPPTVDGPSAEPEVPPPTARRTRPLVLVAAAASVVLLALLARPLEPDDADTTDDALAALDGSSRAASELGADDDRPGRAGPDGDRPTSVRVAGAPRCEPTGCELWRASLRSARVPVATTADRVAYLDGTRLVVREAERGRPAATRDLATVLRSAPAPADDATARAEAAADADAAPDADVVEARLAALGAAVDADAPAQLALSDDTIAVAVGPVLAVLDRNGDPRWARLVPGDVRDLRLVEGAVAAALRRPSGAPSDVPTRLSTFDLDVGTTLVERAVHLLLLDREVAVLREDDEVVGLDLSTSEPAWSRPASDRARPRAEAGLVLVPGETDTEVLRPDGTTLQRVDGVVAAVIVVPDGTLLLTRAEVGSDDAPGGSSGSPVRGSLVALDDDGAIRWTRGLTDLALDAVGDDGDERIVEADDAVVCCPRLFPSVGPAGALVEILEDVGIVVALHDGQTVTVGRPDPLQRELFFTTVTRLGDRELRRSGNRWDLGDVGRDGGEGLTLLDARAVPSAEPLVVVGERTLLAVRPVPHAD
jgi:hypothetical protein